MAAEDEDAITEEKLFWFLTTAYIIRAIGLLDEAKELRLDALDVYGWGNWKEHVKKQIQVDDGFITSVYALCTEYQTRDQAVAFILRGFGCPSANERVAEHPELIESH